MGEGQPFVSQAVDGGSLGHLENGGVRVDGGAFDLIAIHEAVVPPRLVVTENEDDIRWLFGLQMGQRENGKKRE